MRKAIFAAVGIVAVAYWSAEPDPRALVSAVPTPTYRLVHAVGNTESIVRTGLQLPECRAFRDERKNVATLIGAGGSVTCLPED